MKTTPAQVRAALKKHRLSFDVKKAEGCWFVRGEETHLWNSCSLNVFQLDEFSPEEWVGNIVDLSMDNRQAVLRSLSTIEDAAWKAAVEDSIRAVDAYLEWVETVAKIKCGK